LIFILLTTICIGCSLSTLNKDHYDDDDAFMDRWTGPDLHHAHRFILVRFLFKLIFFMFVSME